MNFKILEWDNKDRENIPWDILADVPILELREAAIAYRLRNRMRIHSLIMFGWGL